MALSRPATVVHALLRRQLPLRPEVLLVDAVEHHEVHALVVERVVRLAEELLPVVAHVEEPVVLADHHAHRRLDVLENLGAEVELAGRAELGEIAAEQDEVRLRVELVDVVHGAQERAHEALVDLPLVQVRVGDVGDAEALVGLRVRHVDRHEGVQVLDDAVGGGGRRGGDRHLQEGTPVEIVEPAEERVALFVVLGLDALHATGSSHDQFSFAPSSMTRFSNGRIWRCARALSRNGRVVRARFCWLAKAASLCA